MYSYPCGRHSISKALLANAGACERKGAGSPGQEGQGARGNSPSDSSRSLMEGSQEVVTKLRPER